MLIPSYYPLVGGAEKQLEKLSFVLKGNNIESFVLTRRLKNSLKMESYNGIDIIRLGSENTKLWALASLLYLIKNKNNFDILHVHGLDIQAYVGCFLKMLTGKPLIIKTRIVGKNSRESDFSLANKIRMKFLNIFTDRFIAINKEIEKNLLEMGVDSDNLDLIPNGTKITSLKVNSRKKLNYNSLNVLYVGRLTMHKRVDTILRLVHHFRINKLKMTATIIGDGSDKHRLLKLASELGIIGDTNFLGNKSSPEVAKEMLNHDLLIHPSSMEGFSNTIAESMSVGLPVISSNVGAAPDIIKSGKNGFIFKSFDDLLKVFNDIINNRYCLNDIAEQSIRTAKKIFDIDVVAKNYKIIYNNILSNYIKYEK